MQMKRSPQLYIYLFNVRVASNVYTHQVLNKTIRMIL